MRLRNGKRISLPLLGLFVVAGLALLAAGCSGAAPVGWSGPTLSQQTLYIGNPQGYLLALDIDNGTQRWAGKLTGDKRASILGCAGPTQSSSAIYGTPAASGELVYSTSYNGKVYAFGVADGIEKWKYPLGNDLAHIVSGPVVVAGMVVFGNTDGKVYALDSANGTEKWTFKTEGKVWATPATDEKTVYAPSLDGRVYALDALTGSLIWKTEKIGGIIATPAVTADTVFVGSLDNSLYAFDKASGKEKWRFAGGNFFWAGPILKDNLVVAANTDGKVYGIEITGGKQVWASSVDGIISSTPTLADGSLIIGGNDGRLYVLDAATGKEVRAILSGTSIQGPLASSGSKVYVRTKEGDTTYIKGFDIKNGTPVLSAPLQAAITSTPASGQSSGSFNWQLIFIFALMIAVVFLLMNRRPRKS